MSDQATTLKPQVERSGTFSISENDQKPIRPPAYVRHSRRSGDRGPIRRPTRNYRSGFPVCM
jgi:hypothetical protein